MSTTAEVIITPRDEAITSLVAECIETERVPSEVVEPERLGRMDPDTLMAFARVGLISDANDLLHQMRGQDAAVDGQPVGRRQAVMHPSQGRNGGAWKAVERIYHFGADGMLKPLLDFTVEDARKLMRMAEGQRAAWGQRKGWARLLISALDLAKVGVLSELPPEKVGELDDAAEKAWRA